MRSECGFLSSTSAFHQPSPYMAARAHPFAYNPLVRFVEAKEAEKEAVKSVEKRESESESFYPGYPFVHPYAAQYNPMAQQYANPLAYMNRAPIAPYQQQVLPYQFHGYSGMYNYGYPVIAPSMVEKAEAVVESQ